MNEDAQVEDTWASSGAPNFEKALAIAADLFGNLEEAGQEDLVVVIVDRVGGIYPLGTGEVFPTNEDGPVPMGWLVTRDDIIEMLEGGDDEQDGGEEESEEGSEDGEEEDEEGAEEEDQDTPPDEEVEIE